MKNLLDLRRGNHLRRLERKIATTYSIGKKHRLVKQWERINAAMVAQRLKELV